MMLELAIILTPQILVIKLLNSHFNKLIFNIQTVYCQLNCFKLSLNKKFNFSTLERLLVLESVGTSLKALLQRLPDPLHRAPVQRWHDPDGEQPDYLQLDTRVLR